MRSDGKNGEGNGKGPRENRAFYLVILRKCFSSLGIALVISALVGGLYQDTLHFIWALCAAGSILIAMGWYEYLKLSDSLPRFMKKKKKSKKTPYVWRKEKESRPHKPAFAQNADDIEDDLTPLTTADEEILGEKMRSWSIVVARSVAGVLLFVISFVIPQ